MLDRAATVDEALAVLDRYNLDFDGGPPLHYLLADASGAVRRGRVRRRADERRARHPWCSDEHPAERRVEAQRRTDRRYATAAATLSTARGPMDWEDAMGLLRDVAQGHTRWSAVYEPATGTVRVVAGQRWNTVHTFELAGF